MRYLFLALLFVGCSKKQSFFDKPDSTTVSTRQAPLAAPPPAPTTPDTVKAAGVDSVQVEDTLTMTPWAAYDVHTLTVELGAPQRLYLGIPYGLADSLVPPFGMLWEPTSPSSIVNLINNAKNRGQKLVINMTGGRHSQQMTNGVFDFNKWKTRQLAYNTSAIKYAVTQGVLNGTILMGNLIDEPWNQSAWGTRIPKSTVDQMATVARNIFPTLPTGYNMGPGIIGYQPSIRSKNLQVIIAQYNWNGGFKGDVTRWRDSVLTLAKLDGVKVIWSLNILDGGINTNTSCPLTTTGGPGTMSGWCAMTAKQIRDWTSLLAPYSCAVVYWTYKASMFSNTAYKSAFNDSALLLRSLPKKLCAGSLP